ncbi:MAG: hypothetical protein HYZ16_01870 [Bacteroidetes bacterium]|jgi:hypothetical protein|nr:hypothetical protein [Bacteroidota bacterium]
MHFGVTSYAKVDLTGAFGINPTTGFGIFAERNNYQLHTAFVTPIPTINGQASTGAMAGFRYYALSGKHTRSYFGISALLTSKRESWTVLEHLPNSTTITHNYRGAYRFLNILPSMGFTMQFNRFCLDTETLLGVEFYSYTVSVWGDLVNGHKTQYTSGPLLTRSRAKGMLLFTFRYILFKNNA